jgi:hypothetical protein
MCDLEGDLSTDILANNLLPTGEKKKQKTIPAFIFMPI